MSKNKELMNRYENGEISDTKLFKLQDELFAQQVFITCGVLFVLILIGIIVSLLIWL